MPRTARACHRYDVTRGSRRVELLKALKAASQPVHSRLDRRPCAGGHRETRPQLADAMKPLYAGRWATRRGRAMADVVFGDVSPSARPSALSPRNVVGAPIYYNHKERGTSRQGCWPCSHDGGLDRHAGHSMLLGTI